MFHIQVEINLYVMSPALESFSRFNLWIQHKKKKYKRKEVLEALIHLS